MSRILTRCVLLAMLGLVANPSEASAKLFLITHGDSIKHLGDITDQAMREGLKKTGGSVPSVGFKYGYFGVFWLDFWTWGGEYCLYEGKNYQPISKEMAAQFLGKTVNDLSVPIWYTFPPGLVIIGAIIVLCIPFALIASAKKRRVKALFEDDRYVKAMEQFTLPQTRYLDAMTKWEAEAKEAREANQPEPSQPTPPASDAGYEEAVLSLVREGIPREEAEQNLQAMFKLLAEQQAAAEAPAQ